MTSLNRSISGEDCNIESIIVLLMLFTNHQDHSWSKLIVLAWEWWRMVGVTMKGVFIIKSSSTSWQKISNEPNTQCFIWLNWGPLSLACFCPIVICTFQNILIWFLNCFLWDRTLSYLFRLPSTTFQTFKIVWKLYPYPY